MNTYAEDCFAEIKAKNPGEPEFHQAVHEVLKSVSPVLEKRPIYRKMKILERIAIPERTVIFRVPWVDDKGEVRVNTGYRVEMNSAIGPYKGGLRFHSSVYLGLLKFLAFEQTFKNSLTTLPMGGAKGGSDFDPHGKSNMEVMSFCQSFMIELSRHIGQFTDVPAGDIGVGGREIGYMFGQYKRLKNEFSGVLTGKGVKWGGSFIRPEATGYGCAYFAEEMLATASQSLAGKTCLVSGAGNVAQFMVQKLVQEGARVVTLSDSSGHIYDEEGITEEKLEFILELKNVFRGRISEYVKQYPKAVYTAFDPNLGYNKIWDHRADCAFPCATQNEINAIDASNLVRNGVKLVAEGSNMSTVPEGVDIFQDSGILFAPGKAANAGGVATSGLEMSQNSQRMVWTRKDVDRHLRIIMKNIHASCLNAAEAYGSPGSYVTGANIHGFTKVADAMCDQGIV